MLATKEIMIRKLAERKNRTLKSAEAAVEDIFDIIPELLVEYGGFQLVNFMKLEVRTRKAKIGRNPRTNEEIPLPPRKFIKFTAGKKFKEAIE